MAKVKNCVFCGKEITTGFFRGTERLLNVGQFVSCCKECCEKYEKDAERVEERLSTKFSNYNISSEKIITEEAVAQGFLRYLKEEKENIERYGEFQKGHLYGAGVYSNGADLVAISEFKLGMSLFGLSEKQMKEDAIHSYDGMKWFGKDDITKLEYRYLGEYNTGMGAERYYAFEVRYNDEKEITYKPCICRESFYIEGRKASERLEKATEACVERLNVIKRITGSELPIVEVKEFK